MGPNETIDPALIHPVVNDLPAAVDRLATVSFTPLSDEDAVRLAGPAARGPAETRAWLVRGVYRAERASFGALWTGSGLHVLSGGAGCGAYEKHPAVIFLDRPPSVVFVSAFAAP